MRIGIIIPWFGQNEVGGAELLAYNLAKRLSSEGINIEVITTTSSSSIKVDEWSISKYKTGTEKLDGFLIRRFKVDQINYGIFSKLIYKKILVSEKSKNSPLTEEEEIEYLKNGIDSKYLKYYLKLFKFRYDSFILLPYLYPLIINSLKIVKEKAYLQPCLHDEAYAYMKIIREMFYSCKGILYNAIGEKKLAERIFGPSIFEKGVVVGGGVEITYDFFDEKFTTPTSLEKFSKQKFILLLGRKSKYKNVNFFVEVFKEYKKNNPFSKFKLILAGPGDSFTDEEKFDIFDLGKVSEDEKNWLLQNMYALSIPSVNESLSRVMYEAWLARKPILVHSGSDVTKYATLLSGGGFASDTKQDWILSLQKLDSLSLKDYKTISGNGYMYAVRNSNWEDVINIYKKIFTKKDNPAIQISKNTKRVFQIINSFREGDAISDHSLFIKKFLEENGFIVQTFAIEDTQNNQNVKKIDLNLISSDDSIVYHHSISSELSSYFKNFKGKKALIYHNITPAYFFEKYNLELTKKLEQARKDLVQLRDSFDSYFCDSLFNQSELIDLKFKNTFHLPIPFQTHLWQIYPDSNFLKNLSTSKNICFVGRIAPNKKQEDLLLLFKEIHALDESIKLILTGYPDKEGYFVYLNYLVEKWNLSESVIFTKAVDQSQLLSIYQSSSLFISMSEHEGFCVPLLEAMWQNIPILAFKSTAVTETLADSGILFQHKKDYKNLAKLALLLLTEADLRDKVLLSQEKRREFFLEKNLRIYYDRLVEVLK
jgi:glycosyltransferase involved in cell wall biosynthesis